MRFALVCCLIASVGCKGKPKHRPPPDNTAVVDPKAKPSNGTPPPAPDIVIPHGDGKPPKKTTVPVTAQQMVDFAHMTFRGFATQPHAAKIDKGAEVSFVTEDKPRIAATVTIAPCSDKAVLGPCTPINLAAWTAKATDLKKIIPPTLVGLPTTKFEVGATKLNGVDVIYTFQLGLAAGVATHGSANGKAYVEYSYAYVLYYNDGVNQIRVIAEVRDSSENTIEELVKETPRADLENVAQGFLDIITQLW
jgi:hypothetical protein